MVEIQLLNMNVEDINVDDDLRVCSDWEGKYNKSYTVTQLLDLSTSNDFKQTAKTTIRLLTRI